MNAVLNFPAQRDLNNFNEGGISEIFIYRDMDLVRESIKRGEIEQGEIFIDGDKKYQFINGELKEL